MNDNNDKQEEKSICRLCQGPVDEYGDTLVDCAYGSERCEVCGKCFCDQSC